jgi:general secretion pathway protein E
MVVSAAGTTPAGQALASDASASLLGASPSPPSPEFLKLIPHEFARRHLILSAGTHEGVELLRTAERAKSLVIFNIGVRLGRVVSASVEPDEVLAEAIDRAYQQASESVNSGAAGIDAGPGDISVTVVEGSQELELDLARAVADTEADLLNTQGKAPAVRLVDLVIFEALRMEASDVHVQPTREKTLVRYRLDGALRTVRELPASLASAVVGRIKVMARLDVAERRSPQDGRAGVTVGGSGGTGSTRAGRRVDLRVSILPTTFGERVVIRLLDPSHSPHLLTFAALGMPPKVEAQYLEQVSRPSGIVLATGPTGSGKTTTLYTTLAWVSATNGGTSAATGSVGTGNESAGKGASSAAAGRASSCELNIVTVEDPVEYDLSGSGLSVSQTQVDPKRKVSFASGLRHILRQDPDVIMVGEIRDEETARMAVQASLTGHLVLSTLHTNDAASAVTRLVELGVEPFLVSSSLSAVLAQRLVRMIHAPCRGAGCEACLGSGLKGRTGVFELLVVDAKMRQLIGRRCSSQEVKSEALRSGLVTLREAGRQLVRAGLSTEAEVARVIDATEELET